jgi:pyruvate formate lyase activating enzyme
LADPRWRITLETSLNVERRHLKMLLPLISQWIIDVKDMNPDIYHRYTSKSNRRVIGNLRWLAAHVDTNKVTIRLPHIPDFNTEQDMACSQQQLQTMGFKDFDRFQYIKRGVSE